MSRGQCIGVQATSDGRCRFTVWVPEAEQVDVHLVAPEDRIVPMARVAKGYWHATIPDVTAGARYFYRLNHGPDRPDPASRFQPDGVHGASEVLAPEFPWADDAWFGIPLRDYIFYELHVGTFSPEGTFDAIIPELNGLKELGITALELMPVAQFPGARNWGYDGVGLFAVQNSYGGPDGLKRLVNACHAAGLAVVLDIVYNHFGPEGNYLGEFGPYFNPAYKTLWGPALNYDGPHSDEVREFFLENALYWQTEFHIDALRLDAVHAMRDFSALPFLKELATITHRQADRLNRRFYLIAESDLNDPRLILPPAQGGYGLDAQWSDDFHHCLHVLLTGERTGYYEDFEGVTQLAKVFCEGYAYTGDYSDHRERRHGAPTQGTGSAQFVVYAQNHDQVGNRLLGDRLSRSVSFEGLKLAAGVVILSPFLPLVFMGEEYGEIAPFQYVTSHSDPELVEAVRQGRREEFMHFHGQGNAPDPQDESTFLENKLHLRLAERKQHRVLRQFYRELIQLRKTLPALRDIEKNRISTWACEPEQVLIAQYCSNQRADDLLMIFCFAQEATTLPLRIPVGPWRKLLDSTAREWSGPGTSVPDELTETNLTLTLKPSSLSLFQRTAAPD